MAARMYSVGNSSDTPSEISSKKKDGDPGPLCGLVPALLEQKFLASLLVFIPFGFLSYFLEWERHVVFMCNFFSILPMAWLIGKSTEDLASTTGELLGGLLNATFGNIVEMLLCIAGIRQAQIYVVQCTLIGSILSNLLLVMGTAFMYGGLYFHQQVFSEEGASAHVSLLLLSVLALVLPTLYHILIPNEASLLEISRWSSFLLLCLYGQYLVFQLYTHPDLFSGGDDDDDDDDDEPKMTCGCATVVLATLTLLTAACSEFLISSIEGTIEHFKISKEFIGIIVLPIIGNAAEHYTAIVVAGRNKMDLSLAVAVGSSCQMALLVTPFTVIAGWIWGQEMSLDFHPFQVTVLLCSVLIAASILRGGSSDWLQGSMLVTSYVVIGLIYFLEQVPSRAGGASLVDDHAPPSGGATTTAAVSGTTVI